MERDKKGKKGKKSGKKKKKKGKKSGKKGKGKKGKKEKDLTPDRYVKVKSHSLLLFKNFYLAGSIILVGCFT